MADVSGAARSSRRPVWIALGWAAACLGLVAALFVVRGLDEGAGPGDTGPRRTLTLPVGAAGYTLLTSAPAERFARTARRSLEAQAPGGDVVVGTFTRADEQVVLVGFAFSADSDQGEALAASPKGALEDYFESAGVVDLETFDAGPLGGVLLCGTQADGPTQVTCGWGDDGTLGTLRFATGALADGPAADAATVTVDFREAAEPVDDTP
ncbi:MAG: hypothetical protein ABIQ15_05805 [Nocardioides sp.]